MARCVHRVALSVYGDETRVDKWPPRAERPFRLALDGQSVRMWGGLLAYRRGGRVVEKLSFAKHSR